MPDEADAPLLDLVRGIGRTEALRLLRLAGTPPAAIARIERLLDVEHARELLRAGLERRAVVARLVGCGCSPATAYRIARQASDSHERRDGEKTAGHAGGHRRTREAA